MAIAVPKIYPHVRWLRSAPGAFTGDDFTLAEALAAHLAIALSDSKDIQDRDKSIISRTVIGQAEGILMERYPIGATEAFAFLRRTSQDTNRKLVQIRDWTWTALQ